MHAQVGGAADLGSASLWYTLSVLSDRCFKKKQQQQKLFIHSLLIYDLSGATSLGLSLVPSLQGRVSNSEDLAPDVKECQPEWDGHKVIS